jgi:hypothetical protein
MPTPAAPSFFVDVYDVVYTPVSGSSTPINLYGVKSISYDRSENVLKGMTNMNMRPVAVHTTTMAETVTIECEDFYPIQQLMSVYGPGQLTFNVRAAAHNSASDNQLVDQTVQITPLVIDKKTIQQPSHAFGTYKISGFCMEPSGNINPSGTSGYDATETISFANVSSIPTDNQN